MPSEFWRMHPREFWLYYEAKLPPSEKSKDDWGDIIDLLD